MAEGNHSFTEQDIRKRFGAIVGHTVTEVDTAGVLTASAASRNKGRIGAVIEQSVLGYPADSDRRPDIVIDGQPWEVKATGLKESARGGWCAKEPMSITAVAPEGIVTESFSTSAFWHKAERLLVVYYLYVRPGRGVAVEYAGFEFKGYDLHTWREVDRCRLEADWTVVRDFVRIALAGDVDAEMPNLSTLINPQLLYLDTSPKWPNRPRFRLKASLVTQMARERLDDGIHMIPDQNGLSSMGKLKAHLHGISDTCAGRTLEDLATPFNLPIKTKSGRENKSLAEQVVVRLFTGHAGKISQVPLFAKAGLVFKTMTLTPTGGRTEDMKLNPSIDFDELCDPSVEFEDSAFAAPFIDFTMVVAVLEERYRDCPLCQCIFMGFKTLWLGTYLDAARALWDGMRDLIFSDGLVDAPVLKKDGTPRVTPKTGIAMTAPNWPTRQTAASASSRATSPASASGSMTSRSMASATDSTASSFPLSAISARTPTTAAASGFPPLSMISTSGPLTSSRKYLKMCAASGGRTGRPPTSSTRLSTNSSPPSANARQEHFATGATAKNGPRPSLRKD